MTTTEQIRYDTLLAEIPPKLRPKVAEVKNAQVRAAKAQKEWYDQSRTFRAGVRSLHYRHGMNQTAIARLLGLSRARIAQIVEKKK